MNKLNNHMTIDDFEYHFKESLPKYMGLFDCKYYKLDLFGGEPTLNWNLIEHIVEYTKNDERRVLTSLITNGLLLNEKRVNFLILNRINVGLSFDGLWTDESRPSKNLNTLSFYRKNKDLLKLITRTPMVVINPSNLEMSKNLKFLFEEFDFVPTYKIVKDVNVWKKEHVEKFRNEVKKVLDLVKFYLKRGIVCFPFDKYLPLIRGNDRPRCFSGYDGVAFGPNKKVYPCARFLTNKQYDLDYNFDTVRELSNTHHEKCSQCEWRFCCEGICFYEGLNNGNDENVCSIYKNLFEELQQFMIEMKDERVWKEHVLKINRGEK
jgi:uncharacterized protein